MTVSLTLLHPSLYFSHTLITSHLIPTYTVPNPTCARCGFRDNLPPQIHTIPSPFADVLGTTIADNHVDTITANSIKAVVQDIDRHIIEYKSDVDRLKEALRVAEEELEKMQVFRDLHMALNPPIHTLPDDILLSIFESFLEEGYYDVFETSTAGPWLFGKVCRRWRHLSRSSALLWTSFYIGPYHAASRRAVPILEEVFAKARPVKFELDLSSRFPPPEVLGLVHEQSSAWNQATFMGTREGLPLFFGHTPKHTLSSLSSLRIQIANEDEDPYDSDSAPTNSLFRTILPYFRDAPNLSSFNLDTTANWVDPWNGFNIADVDFPWAQITHLDLGSTVSTIDLQHQLLHICQNLESYVVGYINPSSQSLSSAFSIIACRRLRSLKLSDPKLLTFVDGPLSSISMRQRNALDMSMFSALRRPVFPSAHCVEEMEYAEHSSYMKPHIFLSHFRSITSLTLFWTSYRREVDSAYLAKILIASPGAEIPMPNLTSLSLCLKILFLGTLDVHRSILDSTLR